MQAKQFRLSAPHGRQALLWFGALAVFVSVAVGTQAVLGNHIQSRVPIAVVPSSVSASPNPGGLAATAPNWAAAPGLASKITIVTTQQLLINRDRVRYGRRQLGWSSCLSTIAHSNAVRMANQGYISHTNGPIRDLGCHLGNHAGENVGWYSPVPSDTLTNSAFMASAVHRANILGLNYRYVGTSWVKGSNGRWYIAVEFS
jgi:uncharacterized protein YkwD